MAKIDIILFAFAITFSGSPAHSELYIRPARNPSTLTDRNK